MLVCVHLKFTQSTSPPWYILFLNWFTVLYFLLVLSCDLLDALKILKVKLASLGRRGTWLRVLP